MDLSLSGSVNKEKKPVTKIAKKQANKRTTKGGILACLATGARV